MFFLKNIKSILIFLFLFNFLTIQNHNYKVNALSSTNNNNNNNRNSILIEDNNNNNNIEKENTFISNEQQEEDDDENCQPEEEQQPEEEEQPKTTTKPTVEMKRTPLVVLTPDEYKDKMLNQQNIQQQQQQQNKTLNQTNNNTLTQNSTLQYNESQQTSEQIVSTERFDYASRDAGAVIMTSNAESERSASLLNEDTDKYMITPCEARKWVVVGLSEDILVDTVVLANFERYSSSMKDVQVLGSQSYPVENWMLIGDIHLSQKNVPQSFRLKKPAWVRYLKFRFVSHYEGESLCTLTLIRVHGSTMMQSLREDMEKGDQEVRDVQDLVAEEILNEEIDSQNMEENEKEKENDDEGGTKENEQDDPKQTPQQDNDEKNSEKTPQKEDIVEKENKGESKKKSDKINYQEKVKDTNKNNNHGDDENNKIENVKETQKEEEEDGAVIISNKDFNFSKPIITTLHVTILSSCPEGYTIVDVDMNPGTAQSYLCYKKEFPNSTKKTTVQGVESMKFVTRNLEDKREPCMGDYIGASRLDLRQGAQDGLRVFLCYKRGPKPLHYINIVQENVEKKIEYCSKVKVLGISVCTKPLPPKKQDEENKETKQTTNSNETATTSLPPSLNSPQQTKPAVVTATMNQDNVVLNKDNIFKTLTKKLRDLEIDLTVFKKYLEDLNKKYGERFGHIDEDLHRQDEENAAASEAHKSLSERLDTSISTQKMHNEFVEQRISSLAADDSKLGKLHKKNVEISMSLSKEVHELRELVSSLEKTTNLCR